MPAHQPSTPSQSSGVITGLAKIALVLRNESWRDAGSRGLTPTQSQILALLGSRLGQDLGTKQVAEHLAIAMGTASDSVSALERKGLIEKKRSDSDGRAVVLHLTTRGRRQAMKSVEWPDAVLDAVGDLSPEEQAVMTRGLIKIIHSLQEQGKIPVSRMCAECRFFRPNAHRDSCKPHHCDFIDAPIGDSELRLDCCDMEPVEDGARPKLWKVFINGHEPDSRTPERSGAYIKPT